MKSELNLVLESNKETYQTLESIRNSGFNGTLMSSESLRHALDYVPGDHHFFNLRHIENHQLYESVFCIFVVEREKLEQLKQVIREHTNNFTKIKGFMYSRNIDDFEGSFK